MTRRLDLRTPTGYRWQVNGIEIRRPVDPSTASESVLVAADMDQKFVLWRAETGGSVSRERRLLKFIGAIRYAENIPPTFTIVVSFVPLPLTSALWGFTIEVIDTTDGIGWSFMINEAMIVDLYEDLIPVLVRSNIIDEAARQIYQRRNTADA